MAASGRSGERFQGRLPEAQWLEVAHEPRVPRCQTGHSGNRFVRLWLAAKNHTIRGVVNHSKRRNLED